MHLTGSHALCKSGSTMLTWYTVQWSGATSALHPQAADASDIW